MIAAGLVRASSPSAQRMARFGAVQRHGIAGRGVRPSGQEDDLVAPAAQRL
jgi:hypothetical protein